MKFLEEQKQRFAIKLDESELIVSVSSAMLNFTDLIFSLGNEKLAEKIANIAREVSIFAQEKVNEVKKEMEDAKADH